MTSQTWAAVGAGIYVSGLMLLFGVRTWQHRRCTGTSGFAGFRGRDRLARTAGALFAAAMLAGMTAPVLAATGVLSVLAPPSLTSLLGLLGLAGATVGLVLAWVAQSAMGPSWRIGVDPNETTTLVTSGMFARVRNPIFTAMITAQAGTVLMAPSWLSLAGLAALIAACQLHVRRVEEPYLRATHGPAYRDYTTRAGRFLPAIGRTPPSRIATSAGRR